MKKVLVLVMGLSLALTSCDKSETNIYLDDEVKEVGATVIIAPQASSSSGTSGRVTTSSTPVDDVVTLPLVPLDEDA